MLGHFTFIKGGKGRKERRKEGSEQERCRREIKNGQIIIKMLNVPQQTRHPPIPHGEVPRSSSLFIESCEKDRHTQINLQTQENVPLPSCPTLQKGPCLGTVCASDFVDFLLRQILSFHRQAQGAGHQKKEKKILATVFLVEEIPLPQWFPTPYPLFFASSSIPSLSLFFFFKGVSILISHAECGKERNDSTCQRDIQRMFYTHSLSDHPDNGKCDSKESACNGEDLPDPWVGMIP